MQEKSDFRHESLQDADSIEALLKSITKGIAKGKLAFSDEGGEIVMRPKGLLNLKLTASKEEGRNRFTLRVTWQEEEKPRKGKGSLKVR